MDIKVLQSTGEFREVIETHDEFVLLKHSLTCPISAGAKEEFEQFSKETKIPLYILYVQEAREFSNKISEEFHIKHESPQVLLFKNSEVTWTDSHGRITKKVLEENINS